MFVEILNLEYDKRAYDNKNNANKQTNTSHYSSMPIINLLH